MSLPIPATWAETTELLERLSESRVKLGLDTVRAIARRMGNPQLACPTIHVAGTNGKGSVCAYLERALLDAGLRVGKNTSPHLVSVRERIRIGGVPAPEAAFVRSAAAVLTAAGHDEPTYFELVTLAAFHAFRHAACDAAVIEVGLGGRLDATNIQAPTITVITSISVDHASILGHDPFDIAREKAAITRPGVPCVIARQPIAGMDAHLERLVRARGGVPLPAPAHLPDGHGPGLAGAHQHANAACAFTALEHLRQRGFPLARGGALASISATRFEGRLQRLSEHPTVWLDGAHNEDGCRALAAFVAGQPGPHVALFTALADKALDAMLAPLLPLFSAWQSCDLPGHHRRPDAARLRAVLPAGTPFHASPAEALRACLADPAVASGRATLWIFGSLYLAGAVLERWSGGIPAAEPLR